MKKIKLFINSIISIIIATICIIFFIKGFNSDVTITEIMNSIFYGWKYLILACLLLIISVYCRAYRWQYLFNSKRVQQTNILFKSQLIGYFINNILPIRIGDIVRSYVVAKKTKEKTSYIVGSIVMERFLDIVMILFFTIIVIWHYGLDYLEIKYHFFTIPSYILLFLIPILGYLFYKSLFFIPIQIRQILNDIWRGFSDIQFSHKKTIIFYSLIIWSIYCINVFLIQSMFQAFDLSFFGCLLILVVSSFLQMIPIGFGAVGVFHLGVQGILNKMGIQNHHNFIIMLHLYSIVTYTLFGGYYFLKEDELHIKNIYNDLIQNND